MRIDREVVEQRTLFDLPWSHHRLSSCLNRTESTSFCPFNQRLFQQYLPIQTSHIASFDHIGGWHEKYRSKKS
jgi:hypothetical protein